MKKLICLFTTALITTLLFAQRPIVQDLRALVGKGKNINISWTLPDNPDQEITALKIYRTNKQISSADDLKTLEPIATVEGSVTSFQDSVNDFKDYFYAVIAVTEKPYNMILIGVNATVTGAHLTPKTTTKENKKSSDEKLYKDGQMRETPLPFVSFVEGMNQDDVISKEIADSTKSLSFTKAERDDLLRPYIFEEDLISPDGGDDYLLFDILKNYFAPKNYEESIEQLTKLVGTNISETTRNRAYFYIGESEYYLENFDRAIMNFVKVEQIYPIQAKRWIDSSLDHL